MSEKLRVLYYALWIAHPVLQMGIAAIMLRRGLHRKFKFFFAYILTQMLIFAAVFPAVWWSSSVLFDLFWSLDVFSVAFGFAVIHEVFVDVFRAFHTLRDLGTVLFKWAGLVMLLVAGVVSVSNSSTMTPVIQAVITAQRCVRFIQVGMVLFLLFFAHYVGISRRQHSFGIAVGFGSFALVELVLISSWVGNHLGGGFWMNVVNMVAYNASLLVWLGYVAVKSPARDASLSLLQPQRWEQSLSDIHHPLPSDSLIPMFEGMVDRALSRVQPDAPLAQEGRSADTTARAAAAAAGGFSVPTVPVSSKP